MRVHNRGHSPGYDKDSFTLHRDIRQRAGDQEAAGTSFDALCLHPPTEFALAAYLVLESLYLFFPRRYVTESFRQFPYSRRHPESGINFIFDLAMQ